MVILASNDYFNRFFCKHNFKSCQLGDLVISRFLCRRSLITKCIKIFTYSQTRYCFSLFNVVEPVRYRIISTFSTGKATRVRRRIDGLGNYVEWRCPFIWAGIIELSVLQLCQLYTTLHKYLFPLSRIIVSLGTKCPQSHFSLPSVSIVRLTNLARTKLFF